MSFVTRVIFSSTFHVGQMDEKIRKRKETREEERKKKEVPHRSLYIAFFCPIKTLVLVENFNLIF